MELTECKTEEQLIDELWRQRCEGYFVDWDRVKDDI